MDKEQLIKTITDIGTCEDDVQRRELLATLQEEVVKDYDIMSDLTAKNTQLSNDNESLRSANMKLFLRVGDHSQKNLDDGATPPPPKREFKDLFNEKGGIK